MRTSGSLEEKLTIALTDPCFPGSDAFERALWLLRHPRVCNVSYEELVGPRGGGSRTRQLAAIRRVTDFLGAADADPDAIADGAFNDQAFSFHKGRIGGCRDCFTPRHRALFDQRYGGVLDRTATGEASPGSPRRRRPGATHGDSTALDSTSSFGMGTARQ